MTLIPPGYYSARAAQVRDDYGELVWAKFGRASTGTQHVLIMFEVTDDDEYGGTRVPWFGYFTDKSWERTIESLRHCGFQGDDLDSLNRQKLDHAVSVKLEHEESLSTTPRKSVATSLPPPTNGFVARRSFGTTKIRSSTPRPWRDVPTEVATDLRGAVLSSGRLYPRVAFVNAPNAGNVTLANPMNANEIRDFAAMMKSRISGMSGGSTTQASRDPLKDIPF